MMKKIMWIVFFGLSAFSFAEWDKGACFGSQVYDRREDSVNVEKLDAKIYGIYFSAHWCPPCKQFTPVLVDTYNQIKKNGGAFEIIFVSWDKSKAAMFDYMKEVEMPWLAMKYKCPEAEGLKGKYDVKGIPSLVIIDSAGELVTTTGRRDVQTLGTKAWEKWTGGGGLKKNAPTANSDVRQVRSTGVKGANALLNPDVSRRLDLSSAQKQQIRTIVNATSKKWNQEKDAGAKRADLDRIRQEALEEALKLLTPEQRAVWDGQDDPNQISAQSIGAQVKPTGIDDAGSAPEAGKMDPAVASARAPMPVIILCKTQLLDLPGGFDRFCSENSDQKRSVLRQKTIEKLKSIAASGEQDAVLKAAGNPDDAQSLWVVNAVAATLSPQDIRKVSALPEVKYIYKGQKQTRAASGSKQLSEVIEPSVRSDFTTKGKTVPWNLEKIGAEKVWSMLKVTGEGAVVALLDSGVNYAHEDLRNNLWVNSGETPNNGKDDDGNGLVDDYYGYDFSADSCEVRATGEKQHGTWTGGIVAGDGTGGILTGVAPRARIMVLKGGVMIAAARSFQYALEQGSDIINMSFSQPDLGHGRGFWRLMAEQTVAAGVVLVSGCGNFQKTEQVPLQIRIPEGIPCVIGAGGLDENLDVPPFCSQGPVEWGSVALYEDYPMPDGLTKPDICGFTGPRYPVLAAADEGYIAPNNRIKGNSFSSPHIAGVAALMLSAAPELSAWKVKTILESTAKDLGEKGKDKLYGRWPRFCL